MRLIDADALLEAIEKREAEPAYQHNGEDWYVGLISAEELIWDAPTIEPERKTGKWIVKETISTKSVICSECKKSALFHVRSEGNPYNPINHFKFAESDFCPNCSADMRGKKINDEP